ncbi:methionine biosynthesis protein MetW [Desulfonatronovibrio magnus]|uniref:methionine biosynthesis protein MetW n=1 Tax=Desulfonatronovibrio magnus TaxID=698827 RepID=UPI00069611D5|nr:methionine biosynthesis protein MetW [Desulfonatronovibrio magnus]
MNNDLVDKNINWSASQDRDRYFDQIICSLTRSKSRVLDLGCGKGELLHMLKDLKSIDELGVELDPEQVADCLARGLRVIQSDLMESISDYEPGAFDLIILNQILLSVPSPEKLLKASLQAANQVIVTFPNFAHWRIRLQLMFKGRLPVNRDLPYEWYETPNIRLVTVDDFVLLCRKLKAEIRESHHAGQGPSGKFSKITWQPNLRSSIALFVLSSYHYNDI